MKRLVLLALAASVFGAWLWHTAAQDPGYMVVHFAGYTVETAFVVGISLLLLIILVLYLAVNLLVKLLGVPKAIERRRLRKQGERIQNALLDFIEGRFKHAQNRMQKVAKQQNKHAEVPLLFAARAAHRRGRPDDVARLLDQAEQAASNESVAVALTQYELYRDEGEWERALATLNQLKDRTDDMPMLNLYFAHVYRVLGDWASIESLLPSIKRSNLMPQDRFESLERETYLGLLAGAVEAAYRAGSDSDVHSDHLQKLWQRVPKHLRNDQAIKEDYVRDLIDLGQHQHAEEVIRKTQSKQWSIKLAVLYGLVRANDPVAQLKTAQGWLTKQGRSSALLTTLGRLSLANEHWGQAREHFEDAIALDSDTVALAELARLVASQGDYEYAAKLYQQAYDHEAEALPRLPQPKPH